MKAVVVFISLLMLVGIAAATTTTTLGSAAGITFNGGRLIPLGIENVPGLTVSQITWFYNIIAVGLLFLLGSITSERNVRHWTILVPVMGAMFMFFGWLTSPTGNTFGIIVFCVFLASLMYMKGSLKENFGIGGPGNTLLNIMIFLIVIQSIIGLVNLPSVGLFNNQNVAPTPSEYQSVDLPSQFGAIANSGGWMQAAISAATLFITAIVGIVFAVIGMLKAILLFPLTAQEAFPVITASPMVIQFLMVFQIGEWILLVWLFYHIFYTKSPFVEF
jgi:hypothetical protein